MLRARPWWQILLVCLLVGSTHSGFGLYQSMSWVRRIPFLPTYLFYAGALLILLNATVFRLPTVQGWAKVIRGGEQDWTDRGPGSRWWIVGGFVFLACMLAFIERMQPMYFTCDDNKVQFLPMIVFGGRSLLSGAFPNWDPYQFMGMPAAASGIYALTYPLTYLSYIFSRYLLRTEFLTVEVFVIGHLLLGYFATIWAARVMKVRTSVAVLAALCCVLSGYALLASRNWYYMSPVSLWVPLMAGAIWNLVTRPQLRWVLFLGIVGGVFFHAGNAQMWCYSLLLFGLATLILWLSGTIRFRQVAAIASGLLLAVSIAAPLLIVQLYTTKGVYRAMSLTLGRILLSKAVSFLVPGTWLGMHWALDWTGNHAEYGSAIVYSGTLFLVSTLLLVLTLLPYRWSRKDFGANVWIVCAVAAFLFGLGHDLPLWPFLLRVPGFSSFRLPFKFIGLLDVFAVLGGAIVVERALQRIHAGTKSEIALSACILILLGFHCSFARSSFYDYGVVFSDPKTPVRSYLQPGNGEPVRFLPIFPQRSRTREFERGYPLDLATLYGLYSVSGNDGLADWMPSFRKVVEHLDLKPEETLSQNGISYVLLLRIAADPVLTSTQPEAKPLETSVNVAPRVVETVKRIGAVVYSDHDVTLFKIPNAHPLAFVTAEPAQALPISFSPAGAIVNATRLIGGARITLNVVCRPGFIAYADKTKIPWSCDEWQRVQLSIPAHTGTVELRFQPPWWAGGLMGAALAFIAIGVAALLSRGSQMKPCAPPLSCEVPHYDLEQTPMVQ